MHIVYVYICRLGHFVVLVLNAQSLEDVYWALCKKTFSRLLLLREGCRKKCTIAKCTSH